METSSSSNNSGRIAKNTILLYGRTFITLLIGLYTSRVVLNTLGVEDFGIYNVVGGLVGMFALLSGSMTAATQRYISYELVREGGDSNRVFSATMTIHILLSIIIVVLAETLGLWFLNEKLTIAEDRLIAANWVYQFSFMTFIVNILSIPYYGLIIAHERMDAYAMMSILEAVLKLGCVELLVYFFQDKLIVYGLLMFAVALFIRMLYSLFCRAKFNDSKYHFFKSSPIYKSILGFTGWNLLGNSATILTGQGVNILINVFFGVIPNAARGIASQVDNAVQAFVNNFTLALNPQITKSYASGEKEYAMQLVLQGGKFCFFLFLIIAAPIIACAPDILKLWLKTVPDNAVLFVSLTLVYALIQTWSQTLYILMLAHGDIKKYQIIVGGTCLLAFPLTWLCYSLRLPVESCYYVLIGVAILCLVLRLILLQKMTGISAKKYGMNTICPSISVLLVVAAASFFILEFMQFLWIVDFILVFLITVTIVYAVGMNAEDRKMVRLALSRFMKRFSR